MTREDRRLTARLCVVALCLLAAPTAGDIGGCGQPTELLDASLFFAEKRDLDCERCESCGLDTSRCAAECSPDGGAVPDDFPEGCVPTAHDGEVCLRALEAASCGDYERYMDDAAPTVPTECSFCPPR